MQTDYPCPCCGCLTFPVPREEAVAFICPVCFWENDVFITSDTEPSDENHGMTLAQAQQNYREIGACSAAMLKHVRKPRPEEIPRSIVTVRPGLDVQPGTERT